MTHHPNQPDPNEADWKERQRKIAAQRRQYGNRGIENHGAEFTPIGVYHGMDLPPRLNKWYCRDCRSLVASDSAVCPECESRASKAAE